LQARKKSRQRRNRLRPKSRRRPNKRRMTKMRELARASSLMESALSFNSSSTSTKTTHSTLGARPPKNGRQASARSKIWITSTSNTSNSKPSRGYIRIGRHSVKFLSSRTSFPRKGLITVSSFTAWTVVQFTRITRHGATISFRLLARSLKPALNCFTDRTTKTCPMLTSSNALLIL